MENIPKVNKIKIVVVFLGVVIVATMLLLFREQLFNLNDKLADNEKFFKEYNLVPVNNVFKYTTASEALNLFEAEEAVIFFGFKECKWCQSYAPLLDEYAKANNIETIYYCNIKEDRANNTEAYQKLVALLTEYLEVDGNGNQRIYVPDVYFVKEGKIAGHNNDTSLEQGADVEGYYEQNGDKLKEKLNNLFSEMNTTCDDSAKGC